MSDDAQTGAPVSPLALTIENLRVRFDLGSSWVYAVNGVNLQVPQGSVTGLVGESGSGKSVTGKAVIGLLESPPADISAGRLEVCGVDVLSLAPRERRKLSGATISMIFQNAMGILDPAFTIGYQIREVLISRGDFTRKQARARAVELLARVGIPSPEVRVDEYPHQLSGGMRQRVVIAIAIALEPAFLIADEPTTALDVTVQVQVMDLLMELKSELKIGILLVTHDLALASEYCDDVSVMYGGRIVESAPVPDLFTRQFHPYTKGLLESSPTIDERAETLIALPGYPPRLAAPPSSCSYASRCELASTICEQELPPPIVVSENRISECHHYLSVESAPVPDSFSGEVPR